MCECELTIFDLEGNSINHFTQWDSNRTIVISGTHFFSAPEVHFYNKNSESAYVLKSKLLDEWRIQVEVPNILLTEHLPIMVFVYETEDASTGRTILHTIIPVFKKLKPDTFEYINNIEIINLLTLSENLKQLYDEVSTSENVRVNNENNRIQNEIERTNNENDRIKREKERIQLKEELEAKIESLDEAIENAKQVVKVANNLTTTTEGYVLDARQGAVLNTNINSLGERVTVLEQSIIDEVTETDIDEIVV